MGAARLLVLVGIYFALTASPVSAKKEWASTDDVICGTGKKKNEFFEVEIEPGKKHVFKTKEYPFYKEGTMCAGRFKVSKCKSGAIVKTMNVTMKTEDATFKRFKQDLKPNMKKDSLVSVKGPQEFDGSGDDDTGVGMTEIDESSDDFEGYYDDFQMVFKTKRTNSEDDMSGIFLEVYCEEGKEVAAGGCECGAGEPVYDDVRKKRDTRILGASGDVVYPWMVSIMKSSEVVAMGTLISDKVILTDESVKDVPIGDITLLLLADELEENSYTITIDSTDKTKNGVLMIKLSSAIDFSSLVARPICLPGKNDADDYLVNEKSKYVLTYGQGIVNPESMEYADYPKALIMRAMKADGDKTKALSMCKKKYEAMGYTFEDYMGCAQRKPTDSDRAEEETKFGLCKGDLGAPLLVPENGSKMKKNFIGKWEKTLALVGIFTDYAPWSKKDGAEDDQLESICGRTAAYPARFTRVDSELLDWIEAESPSDKKVCTVPSASDDSNSEAK